MVIITLHHSHLHKWILVKSVNFTSPLTTWKRCRQKTMGWLLRVQKETVSQLETFRLLLHCLSQMGSFSLRLKILNGTTWIIACLSSCESVAGKQKCHLPFTQSSLKYKISQKHCQIYEKQTAEPADLITWVLSFSPAWRRKRTPRVKDFLKMSTD